MSDSRGGAALHSLAGLAVRLTRQWARPVAALAAACGIVAATIVGAVGVGESMRNGLATLALSRLGRIDAAIVGEGFFREQLAEELAAAVGPGMQLVPALVLEVIVDRPASAGRPRLSRRATLLACDDPAALGFSPTTEPIDDTTAAVNPPLAASLDAGAGEPLIVRIPERSAAPADSPLGRRSLATNGRRLENTRLLPAEGISRFSLRPVQVTDALVVTSLAVAQAILESDDVANAIFAVAGPVAEPGADPAGSGSGSSVDQIRASLAPQLADYGLVLEPVAEGRTLRLTSERLILSAEADRAAAEVLTAHGGSPSLIFLATSIDTAAAASSGELPAGSIPYSTLAGVPSTHLPNGDLRSRDEQPLALEPGSILVNRWMADDLAAQGTPVGPGSTLTVRSFEPETLHGQVRERSDTFTVTGVVEMEGGGLARDLVPEVAGVTDEDSIADWDPPFPFDASRVRSSPPNDQDDRYWKTYAATPKAFVSLQDARRIAAGRFGQTTAWHLPAAGLDRETLAAELAAAIDPAAMGVRVLPVREDALQAARGSTPFGGLFVALSSFVVAAGLLLMWLLLGLLVTTRQTEVGLLAAIGFAPRRLARLLMLVGGIAAVVGILIGAAVGPFWSAALLRGLATAWNTSVAAGSSSAFSASLPGITSVVLGAMSAILVSAVAIRQGAARAAARPPLPLLRGLWQATRTVPQAENSGLVRKGLAVIGILSAGVVAAVSRQASAAAAVGGFFAAGGLTLIGMLALVKIWLNAAPRRERPQRSLLAVAIGGLQQQASRTFVVVSMLAVASFLLVAVSSFSLRVPNDLEERGSPTGGWGMLVSFSRPTGVDPLDPVAQEELGLSGDEVEPLESCQIARLRASSGDAADCTNLYATLRPTVIGLPEVWVERGGFQFTGHVDLPAGETNPWTLLKKPATDAIPAILDESTAMWALKLGGVGDRFTLPGDDGKPQTFEIVGLLAPGIMQGWVLVAEDDFTRAFPDQSGYRMAMVATDGPVEPVLETLQVAWGDDGVSVEMARDRLASLYAVQNTFLAGFQALGGLGLLLGTAGIAAVAMQGVFERRQAFSVLRAIGFSQSRLRRLVISEQLLLVVAGLAVGGACGMIALWPALEAGRATLPTSAIFGVAGLMFLTAVIAGVVAVQRAGIGERPR